MKDFTFQRVTAVDDAAKAMAVHPGAMFLAGGTTLVDLMKVDVLTPDTVVDIRHLGTSNIDVSDDAIAIGATVTNSQLAWHRSCVTAFRCCRKRSSRAPPHRSATWPRSPATSCSGHAARISGTFMRRATGESPAPAATRSTASIVVMRVLGVSEHCIATHPSDMCVALIVLDADVHTVRADGTTRSIPFVEFHQAPGDTPHVEVALAHGELITHLVVPHVPAARRSHYLKVRDRASYEFALASAAVVLDLDGDTIRAARLGLGGISTKPWRAAEAEHFLTGRKASDDTFRNAAEIALSGAVAREHNHFKIELAKRTIVRAFATARGVNV